MTEKNSQRKVRSDAARNRQRLLEVAKVAFAEGGMSASLEDIARKAGVGIGTLYRHFPKREALISELYRDQGDRLVSAAEELAIRLRPMEALQEWLLLFIESLGNEQIMAGVLSCMAEEESEYCILSGEALVQALDALLTAVNEDGEFCCEVTSLDILCAITGIATYSPEAEWEVSAKRLVSLMLKGISLSKS